MSKRLILAVTLLVGVIVRFAGFGISAAQADVPAAPIAPSVTIEVFAATATCDGVRTISGINTTAHSQVVTYTLEGRLSSYVNGNFVVKCKISSSTWTTSTAVPPRYAVTWGLKTDTLTHLNPFKICVYAKGTFSNWPLSNIPYVEDGSRCESS